MWGENGREREAERKRIVFRHSAKRCRALFKRLKKGQQFKNGCVCIINRQRWDGERMGNNLENLFCDFLFLFFKYARRT